MHTHRSQAGENNTRCDTGETHLGDWCVDNSLLAKLVKETFRGLHKMSVCV